MGRMKIEIEVERDKLATHPNMKISVNAPDLIFANKLSKNYEKTKISRAKISGCSHPLVYANASCQKFS